MRMSCLAGCTIASNNYLAFARVLVESYGRHHPGADFYVCVADEPHVDVSYQQLPFTCIFASELGIPEFKNLAYRYDVVEFNTAVKPYFLSYLRDRYGLGRVVYLDPDIWVHERLTHVESALESSAAVLTPHLTGPLIDDMHPSEKFIRTVGIYNLGFLALRLDESTRSFLEWWKTRLHDLCRVDLKEGLFVDQSWMDFAPAYLESVEILRSPLYNIAYWNLTQRHLERNDGRWKIGRENIRFFHFSGLDLGDLDTVSRHQNRVSLGTRSELKPLFLQYKELVEAAGHEFYRKIQYKYGYFSTTEILVPKSSRKLLAQTDPQARRWRDPFDVTGTDCYFHWLIEPIEFPGGSLNRAVLAFWESRPDLVKHFARVCDDDLRGFVRWLRGDPSAAAELASPFLEALRAGKSKTAHNEVPQPHNTAIDEEAESLLATMDLGSPGNLKKWLNEPVPGAAQARPIITRLAFLIFGIRPDLQVAFPDPLDADSRRFARWFVTYGAPEYGLHSELVRTVLWSLPRRDRVVLLFKKWVGRSPAHGKKLPLRSTPAHPAVGTVSAMLSDRLFPEVLTEQRGVNLLGYFGMPTGVGQMARATARVLNEGRIPFVEVPLDQQTRVISEAGQRNPPSGSPYPIFLLHVNADMTPQAFRVLPFSVTASSYRIGYWFWELAHFPLGFADRFRYLDEVWAPSRFCQRAYEVLSDIPVRYVPPYVPSRRPSSPARAKYRLDENRFYFFWCFDILSVPERKNPFAAIEVIRRLQRQTEKNVGLVLKITRAEEDRELLRELRRKARGLPVVFLTKVCSDEEMGELMASVDALLSLHRSEGLGLLPIEMLYLSKPVIATGYGGVTDFLDETTGYPVDYQLARIQEDCSPYPLGATWAEPSVEHAVRTMKDVVESPVKAAERVAAGKARVEEIYGLEAACQRFSRELDRVFRGHQNPPQTSTEAKLASES